MDIAEQNRQLLRLRYRIVIKPQGGREEVIGAHALLEDAKALTTRHLEDPEKAGATLFIIDGTIWNAPPIWRGEIPPMPASPSGHA